MKVLKFGYHLVDLAFIVTVSLFVLASCEKDVVIPPTTPEIEVHAGVSDTNFHTLNPVFEINTTWDAQNLYGIGADSLDLDQDGLYDLTLHLSLLNADSIHLLGGQLPQPFPSCYITGSEELEILTKKELVYVGLGTVATFYWADTLEYNELIENTISNENLLWRSMAQGYLNMWAEHPSTNPFMTYGTWYNLNAIRYIGIRFKGKRGWIEVDCTNHQDPKILSYAYLK